MFDHEPTKNSKIQDISRLLDPAYSSIAPSSLSQTRVYVDHHGHLHDPDYRHFPPTSPKKPARRNRRASSGASANPFSSRPSWELGVDDDEFDEYDLDGELEPSSSSSPKYPTFTLSSYSPSPSYSSSSPSPLSTNFHESPESSCPLDSTRKLAVPHFNVFRRPSHSRQSRRCSLDSAEPVAEEHVYPYESQGADEVESVYTYSSSPRGGRTSRASRARRSFEAYEDEAFGFVPATDAEGPTEEAEAALKEEASQNDKDTQSEKGVPSCTQVMRKQWQAVSLSVSFGVFRWRRRMRRVLSR
ncbi:hypothetical protein D9758_005506 [Tetrapyrgos nigripes]|uniref:Uncharacterized protein n=1 Tax=Tetrapyrgos nigripes TaxID=182062 RepID=A0A8H5LP99_9AGAR|nr:hypothetical protein D9758_005506 [Tetrapyrgos nigripes]